MLDLHGHKPVGWAMDSRMKTELVCAALKQAIGRTGASKGLILHSDRGVQYTSKSYQKLLKKHEFICSMSRKGNCYDYSPMGSFWGKLKMEWLNDYTFKTRAEAKKAVLEYIEFIFNRRRTHSSNDTAVSSRRHEVRIRLIGVTKAFYVSTFSEQGHSYIACFGILQSKYFTLPQIDHKRRNPALENETCWNCRMYLIY